MGRIRPMEKQKPCHIRKLSDELSRRQRVNQAYSMRSYARFLGLDSGVLSAVLANKRSVPHNAVAAICKKLELKPVEQKMFEAGVSGARRVFQQIGQSHPHLFASPDDFFLLEESELTYRVLSEWEYFAVLSLFDTVVFREDEGWIAARLRIDRERVRQILADLQTCGLVERAADGRLRKTRKNLETTDGVVSKAIRQGNKEVLQMAMEKIDNTALEQRSFSTVTIALNPKNLGRARDLIKTFRRNLMELLEADEPTEVFQLAIQLFPLTAMKDWERES